VEKLGTEECRPEKANWPVCGNVAYQPGSGVCAGGDDSATVAKLCGANGDANP
jgi:hypothetical protein